MSITRRQFIKAAAGILVAAPAIVRAEWLMPCKGIKVVSGNTLLTTDEITREALKILWDISGAAEMKVGDNFTIAGDSNLYLVQSDSTISVANWPYER